MIAFKIFRYTEANYTILSTSTLIILVNVLTHNYNNSVDYKLSTKSPKNNPLSYINHLSTYTAKQQKEG